MRLKSSFSIAFSALRAHKVRGFLASVGIMIGIASVIIMVAIGKGSQKEVLALISQMGENLITVTAGEMKFRGGALQLQGNVNNITPRDAFVIGAEINEIKRIIPYEYAQLNVKYGNSTTSIRVAGSTPEFFPGRKFEVERGTAFDERDLKQSSRVAIIGKTTVVNVFGEEDPMGQTIRIKTIPFKVVGVLKTKGVDTDGADQDDVILVPLTTLMRRILNQTYIRTIYFEAVSKQSTTKAVVKLRTILRERHKLREGQDDDFIIQNQVDLEQAKLETSRMFTDLIVGVASISLVVGGIGILAVMLISVKERTREIGMRRAVGATKMDIIQQFIVESLLIGVLGGVIGVSIGVGITLGLSMWGPWTLVLDYRAVVVATGVCFMIGIVSGIFPAIKASRLDPMEALRVE